jgi:hypothetical protein
MRRPVRVGIILTEVVAGLALARVVRKEVPKLRGRAKAKFSQSVAQEQMESLLGRCHGLVETTRVSQSAVTPGGPVPTPARVA